MWVLFMIKDTVSAFVAVIAGRFGCGPRLLFYEMPVPDLSGKDFLSRIIAFDPPWKPQVGLNDTTGALEGHPISSRG